MGVTNPNTALANKKFQIVAYSEVPGTPANVGNASSTDWATEPNNTDFVEKDQPTQQKSITTTAKHTITLETVYRNNDLEIALLGAAKKNFDEASGAVVYYDIIYAEVKGTGEPEFACKARLTNASVNSGDELMTMTATFVVEGTVTETAQA